MSTPSIPTIDQAEPGPSGPLGGEGGDAAEKKRRKKRVRKVGEGETPLRMGREDGPPLPRTDSKGVYEFSADLGRVNPSGLTPMHLGASHRK